MTMSRQMAMMAGRRGVAVLRVLALVVLVAAVCGGGPVAAAEPRRSPAPTMDPELYEAQMRMFRAMRPRLIIEVTEENVNEYLREHPDDFEMPDGLDAPMVRFRDGHVEVSARARLLFVPSRVSVRLVPYIQDGYLALRVTRVSAGWLPLPRGLHGGVADMLTGVINNALDLNGVKLSRVEAFRGMVRATAQVQPLEEETPQDPREPGRRPG